MARTRRLVFVVVLLFALSRFVAVAKPVASLRGSRSRRLVAHHHPEHRGASEKEFSPYHRSLKKDKQQAPEDNADGNNEEEDISVLTTTTTAPGTTTTTATTTSATTTTQGTTTTTSSTTTTAATTTTTEATTTTTTTTVPPTTTTTTTLPTTTTTTTTTPPTTTTTTMSTTPVTSTTAATTTTTIPPSTTTTTTTTTGATTKTNPTTTTTMTTSSSTTSTTPVVTTTTVASLVQNGAKDTTTMTPMTTTPTKTTTTATTPASTTTVAVGFLISVPLPEFSLIFAEDISLEDLEAIDRIVTQSLEKGIADQYPTLAFVDIDPALNRLLRRKLVLARRRRLQMGNKVDFSGEAVFRGLGPSASELGSTLQVVLNDMFREGAFRRDDTTLVGVIESVTVDDFGQTAGAQQDASTGNSVDGTTPVEDLAVQSVQTDAARDSRVPFVAYALAGCFLTVVLGLLAYRARVVKKSNEAWLNNNNHHMVITKIHPDVNHSSRSKGFFSFSRGAGGEYPHSGSGGSDVQFLPPLEDETLAPSRTFEPDDDDDERAVMVVPGSPVSSTSGSFEDADQTSIRSESLFKSTILECVEEEEGSARSSAVPQDDSVTSYNRTFIQEDFLAEAGDQNFLLLSPPTDPLSNSFQSYEAPLLPPLSPQHAAMHYMSHGSTDGSSSLEDDPHHTLNTSAAGSITRWFARPHDADERAYNSDQECQIEAHMPTRRNRGGDATTTATTTTTPPGQQNVAEIANLSASATSLGMGSFHHHHHHHRSSDEEDNTSNDSPGYLRAQSLMLHGHLPPTYLGDVATDCASSVAGSLPADDEADRHTVISDVPDNEVRDLHKSSSPSPPPATPSVQDDLMTSKWVEDGLSMETGEI